MKSDSYNSKYTLKYQFCKKYFVFYSNNKVRVNPLGFVLDQLS